MEVRDGVTHYNDLFLDVIYYKDKETMKKAKQDKQIRIIDQEDLKEALDMNTITEEQYEIAKNIPVESLKKLSSYSSVLPWLHLPFRFRTAKKGWKLISTVICDFFLLQNLHKFKITKHPVIFVDAPLDKKIPFDPSKVQTYMNFIPYFLKT